ncbi:MAG: acyl-CoA dehydrogenase family protein [Polyangiaceae bacterium]|nr:acyl-CoA dehydrogenase family protein [Polyangiaceae bacterium]
MFDFTLTEEQALLQSTARDFAARRLTPTMRAHEEARGLSAEAIRGFSELGLAMASLPEAIGGQGLGMLEAVLCEEELGAADPGAALAAPGPGAFGRALVELGTEDQARPLLAPFSSTASWGALAWTEARALDERPGFAATATPEEGGYRVRGQKAFVTHAPLAGWFVVCAQVDPAAGWGGLGAFVVERGEGVTVGARHRTLGLDAAAFADITVDAWVPAGRRLARGGDAAALSRLFAKQGLLAAARAVGLARSAFEVSRDYCEGRRAFGKPIGHFQAVAFKLADRLIDVESARWLVWRAAWAWDHGGDEVAALRHSAQAIPTALEAAMRAADDAVQLHGGAGFMRDYPVEKMMRDAKQLALCAPTSTTLDQLATALDLGLVPDPALTLPTPETQPIFT